VIFCFGWNAKEIASNSIAISLIISTALSVRVCFKGGRAYSYFRHAEDIDYQSLDQQELRGFT